MRNSNLNAKFSVVDFSLRNVFRYATTYVTVVVLQCQPLTVVWMVQQGYMQVPDLDTKERSGRPKLVTVVLQCITKRSKE